MALMVTLAVLSLAAILMLAMLSQASVEHGGARNEASMASTRQLEEAAVNIVIARIQSATEPPAGSTWMSQPGAIRQFDRRIGPATRVFKLYSAMQMSAAGADGLDEDIPPADWATRTHEWVDLNEPVRRDGGGGGTPERRIYPIVDPEVEVEGFAVEPAPGATGSNAAPMPVRWLYLLRDGTVAAGERDGEGVKVGVATSDNPVVGRMGFWADDETCKVNINTASEPTPWDLPRASAESEFENAWHQPANREYQRYPGHPTMTALGPVLFPNTELSAEQKEEIYGWLPRVGTGGTQAGTVRIGSENFLEQIQPGAGRLYDNSDELALLEGRTEAPIMAGGRTERTAFFLTASSRAPELNVFGLPRVSMWPMHADAARRTAVDGLLGFCSEIGGNPFYFQRRNNRHPSEDWTEILRNRQLYAYLQEMTGRAIPGYGGATLEGRWGMDRDQILTQIFDYIRITNLNEPLLPSAQRYAPSGDVTPIRIGDTAGFGRQYMLSQMGLHFICNGHGAEGITTKPGGDPANPGDQLGANERMVQASVLFEASALTPGFHELRSEPWSMVIEGANTFTVDGKPLGFPASMTYTKGGNGFGFPHFWHNRHWGGQSALRATILRGGGGNYQLRSPERVVLSDGGDADAAMGFSGGTLTVRVYHSQTPNAAQLVQTLSIEFPPAEFPMPQLVRTGSTGGNSSAATNPDYWWGFNTRYANCANHPHMPGELYADAKRRWPGNREGGATGSGIRQAAIFRPEDTLRTLIPFHGDMRHAAGRSVVDASVFRPNAYYHDKGRRLDHTFAEPVGTHLYYFFGNEPGVTSPSAPGTQLTDAPYHWAKLPIVPQGTGRYNLWGDFDNGHAHVQDGAWINKPDEGNTQTGDSRQTPRDWPPYFFWNPAEQKPIHFSPNRIMPSAVMVGSLPTGIKAGRPWETLLFRPQPGHPGAGDPPDHMLLDLFWMPVVEPYALSERFSTAGKINLNHRIEPFHWIERTSGLRAVLRSEEPMAIRNDMARASKLFRTHTHDDLEPHIAGASTDPDVAALYRNLREGNPGYEVRKPVDVDATLLQFQERFEDGRFFASPSEVCEVHLVREGESLEAYRDGSFWRGHVTTGDNTRERPYANLLPRLTTRSNSYRIHYRVQALQTTRSGDPGEVGAGSVVVLGEGRGSTLVERYLDPELAELEGADPATTLEPLDRYYRMRVINSRRFMP